ncbi:MAG: TonB family protein, partial [Pseudomonadota bacterium]
LPKPARIPWVAAFVSAALHAFLLWGGGARPAYRPVVVVKDEPIVQLVMPTLDEDKEPPVEELESQVDPGVQVPQLPYAPTLVDVTNSFVQPLDMRAALQNNFDASKLTTIPLKIAPAGSRPGGLKDLFNLSQLDHVPEAIVQPAPEFPYNLKNEIDHAEVVVEFIVDTHGETRDIRVLSSTHAGFERASIEGVTKWRFRPGLKTGRKVNTRMMVPIRFLVQTTE